MAMAMATTFFTASPPPKPRPPHHRCSLVVRASSSTDRYPTTCLAGVNVDYINGEFGGHGVKFAELGSGCVATLATENGSSASLMLPSGLITSYKPQMWHGGAVEVLHTTVSEGQNGAAVVQGGVSLGFKCRGAGTDIWSPAVWSLLDVSGGPDEFIQVQLKCNDLPENIEMKYTVTLEDHLLCSELSLKNNQPFPVHLMGTFMTHLTVSTPDATYAIGLQGSNYISKPPFMSEFSLIPPGYDSRESWGQKPLDNLMSRWSGSAVKNKRDEDADDEISEEEFAEEDDDHFHMTEKISRVYTNTPRRFSLIDRGKRNSVITERNGFNEMYIFSPGSSYEWYGKHAYVCVGPSALLKAVTLGPQESWSGFQCLHNPNS